MENDLNEVRALLNHRDYSEKKTERYFNLEQNLKSICDSQPCAPSTRNSYFKNMMEFTNWLGDADFTIDSVMLYRNEFLSKRTDIAVGAKNAKLAALRTLCRELYFRRIIEIDITPKLKNFKAETGHKKDGLDLTEIQKVRVYINAIEKDLTRARLKAIFSLCVLQGFRQCEVCNVLVEDFNFADNRVKILGKGKDEKEGVDLHPSSVLAVREYLKFSGRKSGFLFVSEKGTSIGERLTERGFRKIWEKIFDATGIDRSAHGFRHFFVTTLLEEFNGNTGIVKKFSRHLSTTALEMYDDRKKKKAHNATFYKAFKFEETERYSVQKEGETFIIEKIGDLPQITMPLK